MPRYVSVTVKASAGMVVVRIVDTISCRWSDSFGTSSPVPYGSPIRVTDRRTRLPLLTESVHHTKGRSKDGTESVGVMEIALSLLDHYLVSFCCRQATGLRISSYYLAGTWLTVRRTLVLGGRLIQAAK